MLNGNDKTKLSTVYFDQLAKILKRVHTGSVKYEAEIKTQTIKSTTVYIYSTNRENTKAAVQRELKKTGMNLETGKGHQITNKSFSGSSFGGHEYNVQHDGDNFKHKIILRYKPLNIGKISSKTKTGQTERKENKGILFEKDLSSDLREFIKTNDVNSRNIKYKRFLSEYFKESNILDNGLSEIIDMGALNQKRPLVFSGGNVYVGGESTDIGKTVTDITLKDGKNKTHYLSLKFGNTVTFMNSGVTKIFPERDFRKGSFDSADAKTLLKLFGVNEKKFISVFLQAEKTGKMPKTGDSDTKDVENVTGKVNLAKLHTFLKTAVGHGYWLIHLDNAGSVHYYNMTESKMTAGTRPTSVTVLYPRETAPAKRIDVLIDTPMFELKMNIRNKQAGVFPSHIMLDYKIK